MARPEAEQKMGFFPIPPQVIPKILSHLRPSPITHQDAKRNAISIIDPCAGEGAALSSLLGGLALPQESGYAIELDDERGETIRRNHPKVNTISPASFFGCQITSHAFGLAYVNSPFSDEFGGGKREELSFLQRATYLLMEDGILVFVCPCSVLAGKQKFINFIDAHYSEIQIYRFPDDCRNYNEIVLIAQKRGRTIPEKDLWLHGELHQRQLHQSNPPATYFPKIGDRHQTEYEKAYYAAPHPKMYAFYPKVWDLPRGWRPHTFKKVEMTDRELERALTSSPLNRLFAEPPPRVLARPPLSLERGHLGLVLASGMLDGQIDTPLGSHVVRGSSYKSQFYNADDSSSHENPNTGAVTTKDVHSQQIVTMLRCLDEQGVIHTHSNDAGGDKKEESEIAIEFSDDESDEDGESSATQREMF